MKGAETLETPVGKKNGRSLRPQVTVRTVPLIRLFQTDLHLFRRGAAG